MFKDREDAGAHLARELEHLRGGVVAPTGIDPVTFRFSVERSTN